MSYVVVAFGANSACGSKVPSDYFVSHFALYERKMRNA